MAEVMMVAVGQTADPPAFAKDDSSKSEGKSPACEVLQVFLADPAVKDDKVRWD
jgi:hypothetical protein